MGNCGGALWPRYYSEHSDPLLEERPSLNLKEEEKGALFPCHPLYSSPFHSFYSPSFSLLQWRLMSLSTVSEALCSNTLPQAHVGYYLGAQHTVFVPLCASG